MRGSWRAGPGATLLIVSVIEAPSHLAEWAATRDSADEVIENWTKQHDESRCNYLDGIASGIDGPAVETLTLAGNPVRKINELVHHVESPVIVMASHGRSGWQQLRAGSVTTAVVQSCECPVIVVRVDGKERADMFARPLIALDGSEFAEEALGAVQAVLGTTGLSLHLVRVVETATAVGGVFSSFVHTGIEYYLEALHAESEDYLETVAAELRDEGHEVTWEVRQGAVADELEQAASERGAGLIVMSTHGRSGFQHLLLGSVADRVLHRSELPLFVVRPESDGRHA